MSPPASIHVLRKQGILFAFTQLFPQLWTAHWEPYKHLLDEF